MAGIEFRVLGDLEVLVDGRPLAIGSAKQRALLAEFAAIRDPELVVGAVAAGIGYVPAALTEGGVPCRGAGAGPARPPSVPAGRPRTSPSARRTAGA